MAAKKSCCTQSDFSYDQSVIAEIALIKSNLQKMCSAKYQKRILQVKTHVTEFHGSLKVIVANKVIFLTINLILQKLC